MRDVIAAGRRQKKHRSAKGLQSETGRAKAPALRARNDGSKTKRLRTGTLHTAINWRGITRPWRNGTTSFKAARKCASKLSPAKEPLGAPLLFQAAIAAPLQGRQTARYVLAPPEARKLTESRVQTRHSGQPETTIRRETMRKAITA